MKKNRLLILFVLSILVFTWCEKGSKSYKTSSDPTNIGVTMMSQNIVPWWYLYRNLDLSKAADKEEYEQLQKDRNLILEYQTKTSSAVNKFIDTIHQDLLDACKEYETGYETTAGTYYERDVCVDHYIRNLYQKLKTELNNPQKNYSWKDAVLLAYYKDLQWDHPFVRYFVDLYTYLLKRWRDLGEIPEYPLIWPLTKNPDWWYRNDEEAGGDLAMKNWSWFYTYWAWNITKNQFWSMISSIGSWIVLNGHMLKRIEKEYWYHFPYWSLEIIYGTSPMIWPFVLHHKTEYGDYIYQIIGSGAWSWEFILLVRVFVDWLWIPLGQCGYDWYVLFPNYPLLFGECKKWQNSDPLTIFTQEYNLYEHNRIPDLVENFTFFLRALESTRVLSK